MGTKLTPAFVKRATAAQGKDRSIYWDSKLPGFGLVVTAAGARSYCVQYRAGGHSRRMTIDGVLGLEGARKQARALLGDVAKHKDPLSERRAAERAGSDTLESITREYARREKKRLRTIDARIAALERLVLPKLGARQISDISRSEIVRLLDRIEDECGAVMADHVLAYVRAIMNWHAARSDDFRSPIVRRMRRTNPKERARKRTLSDSELRVIWQVACTAGVFGRLVRFLLLTASRRNEGAKAARDEIEKGVDWVIPSERYKSKVPHLIPLSKAAQAVLTEAPRIHGSDYYFTTNGKSPISGFASFKRTFDAAVLAALRAQDPKAEPLPNWRLHDLRRTARSLMSRAGVNSDIAERALGHTMEGVRGTYDLHAYRDEKAHAFEALAAQIERIINPQPNVISIKAQA
jgi:integrase